MEKITMSIPVKMFHNRCVVDVCKTEIKLGGGWDRKCYGGTEQRTFC